jgi:penicillin amidase
MGYRTPESAALGLTIPGLPFILVGRNEAISWTGTNMQASSSVLYRLPDDWEPVDAREEPIGVRFWFDRTATIRESEHGPVLTDADLLEGRLSDGDIAITWRGHQPSDEASAFLRASRAQSWDEFREAFRTYAVSGQNMLYADREGNIGQIMAVEAVPAAAKASRVAPVLASDEEFAWSPGVMSPTLPVAFNPEPGFLVSANNIPVRTSDPLVPQGNSNDRVLRMTQLLEANDAVTLDDLAKLQLDTFSLASHATARALVDRAAELELAPPARALVEAIGEWDGFYETDSTGAVAYQRALGALISRLYEGRYGDRIQNTIRSGPYVHDFVRRDLAQAPKDSLAAALESAAAGWSPGERWGDLHRLRLRHPVGNVPVLGRWFTFGDYPYAGSTTTILKAAHGAGDGRHATRFGANARLLVDMGGLDDNRVVLMGGQDGWLGSDRLLDQIPDWLAGRTIPLPLSAEGQAARAVRTMRLGPAAADPEAR